MHKNKTRSKPILHSLLFFFTLSIASNLQAQQTSILFKYYQRLIFLKVKVATSDSLLFLLDTGANTSAIDEKTANSLHLKNMKMDTVEGTAGTILVPCVLAKSVSIGNSKVKNISFTKYDLSNSLSLPGQHLDGILEQIS